MTILQKMPIFWKDALKTGHLRRTDYQSVVLKSQNKF